MLITSPPTIFTASIAIPRDSVALDELSVPVMLAALRLASTRSDQAQVLTGSASIRDESEEMIVLLLSFFVRRARFVSEQGPKCGDVPARRSGSIPAPALTGLRIVGSGYRTMPALRQNTEALCSLAQGSPRVMGCWLGSVRAVGGE
jgi:hypothetical protein